MHDAKVAGCRFVQASFSPLYVIAIARLPIDEPHGKTRKTIAARVFQAQAESHCLRIQSCAFAIY